MLFNWNKDVPSLVIFLKEPALCLINSLYYLFIFIFLISALSFIISCHLFHFGVIYFLFSQIFSFPFCSVSFRFDVKLLIRDSYYYLCRHLVLHIASRNLLHCLSSVFLCCGFIFIQLQKVFNFFPNFCLDPFFIQQRSVQLPRVCKFPVVSVVYIQP